MMGSFVYCLGNTLTAVGRVMKFSRGHLAIPMGHKYYSDLLEMNKNNMNEGQF